MDLTQVERIAEAVLYEGYMLYPYRASSVKNRQRFNWGTVAPRAYGETQRGSENWEMQTQCLATGSDDMKLTVKLRFLHLMDRGIGKPSKPSTEVPTRYDLVPYLEANGQLYQAWQEAVEREVLIPKIELGQPGNTFEFTFPAERNVEAIRGADGRVEGLIVRTQRQIHGEVGVVVERVEAPSVFGLSVVIRNSTPFDPDETNDRDSALLSSLVSTHTILSVDGGEFISLLDPPKEFSELAAQCRNIGTYPVLAGSELRRDCMLSSPIILYDYPQIAPESAGELFDGTEIDEILTLRIMTLTDEEKREMRATDERARKILERTELLPEEQLLKMHGALRGLGKKTKVTHG